MELSAGRVRSGSETFDEPRKIPEPPWIQSPYFACNLPAKVGVLESCSVESEHIPGTKRKQQIKPDGSLAAALVAAPITVGWLTGNLGWQRPKDFWYRVVWVNRKATAFARWLSATVERTDAELIAAVLRGDSASFEPLLIKYQPRVFATARRYARRESEVEDIVQEVFLKAFHRLSSFRGDAPFEHWLMRLAVRTCYDFLRAHQRNREMSFADFADDETDWLDHFAANPADASENAAAARELVEKVLDQLSPAARLVITLLEIEDRSVKEVAALTGWSVPVVKIRAFRARAQMRKCLEKLTKGKYL